MTNIEAVDLFAGTGWGVALQRLGIEEHGVELMPEAQASRAANGMRTWLADVWDVLETAPIDSPEFRAALLIASPPCQTFSMAGGGKGRQALDEVVRLIDERAYLRVADLRAFGESHDPRTALVLTPLAYIARHVPTYVVLEQVPPVLPVWKRYAAELEKWGYSVATGIVYAEEHGVPQTRKRAILVARADSREARLPTPAHNRYNPRTGVASRHTNPDLFPWVSMAEALGRGMTERPSMTVTGGGAATGGAEPFGNAARQAMGQEQERGAWLMSNYSSGGSEGVVKEGNKLPRTVRAIVQPASTITSKAGSMQWIYERPATTITSDSRVWPPGHKINADDIARLGEDEARQKYGDRAGSRAERITLAEAAALQSYPEGFEFSGTGGKQFLQVGNAVPPLMAEAILREVLS